MLKGARDATDFVGLADCTRHRTVTVYFACLEENRQLNACLKQFTTDQEYDKVREEALTRKMQQMDRPSV